MARSNKNSMFTYTNPGGKRAATRTIDLVNDNDAFSGVDNITIGTSSTAESHTSESSKALAGYVTCSATSGSTSYEPWYFKTTMTGAGQVGGRLLSHTYTNVALGGWCNALKGYMEFGTSGKTTGLASAIVAEMKVANANLGSGGAYMPLEVELVYGGSSVVSAGALSGNHVAFATYRFSGDTDGDFDDNGFLMTVTGLTAGSGHVLSANSNTLRMGVGTTTKYMILSSTENSLDLGAATTPIDLSGAFTTGINIDADGTTGISITSNFTGTTGISIAGTATNSISVTGNATNAFATSTGTFTAGLSLAGTIDNGVDFSSMTVGTNTDGSLIKAGTFGSRISFATASQYAMAYYLNYTATSGTFRGMRLRIGANPSSGSSQSIDGLLVQVSAEDSKDATTLNSGFFEIIPKGTNTVTTARGLLVNADSAASQTMTTQIMGHFRVHTRGDETITNDEMLRLENEAVGGNGRQLDSFIRVMDTNLSGGIKAAAYLIDGGTDTDLLATAVMRLPDDGTVCHDTDTGSATDLQFSDFSGYWTIVVGSATRYVPLLASKPSDLS